ncbi:MAG: PleD family two-component system response regulator [Alphaproteobacteria bacterium]|nr:PleD family two-component system response regulator [Alphaproteobacteria bacterium]MDE1985332.1 PleD family two-component system response regulator [Alphaproteobacteria bacterium]MDE2162041.1 PleD family two-component system response regulator [Alphaproteobacteria bacterium]MDE2265385.1 PleD family two-component system response regulator [Alphaproteobacteria bacterium]MDE2500281.1 PleD family two-component system response regulator [Alphaproteobacteria bacterium]
MTARVLVVDDILSNVKLLEAKLTTEYFEVVTAYSGQEALDKIDESNPDIVLLDVMMPGMDGFEVCRRIKANPLTAHVPVVMVTALDQPSDRVAGLEAGADDFLTKPVDDAALFARVRSLVRLKMMTDELRMRETTGQSMGLVDPASTLTDSTVSGRILIIEDRPESVAWFSSALQLAHDISAVDTFEEALVRVRGGDYDLIIVNLGMRGFDGLRLCSQLRSLPEGRNVPILVVVSDGDRRKLNQALEMGVNDYLTRPVDKNELVARVRTQLRKKLYADRLRQNVQLSLEMAITDQLTGLHNRRYMSRHLSNLLTQAHKSGKPLAFVIMDIDFFKSVNDNHGHDIGDEVLREFAKRISANVRGLDLACRYGGEEFVVVMPDTDVAYAYSVAERLRKSIETTPIEISRAPGKLTITISIGIASSESSDDKAEDLLRRADQALYRAKNGGRNRVVADAA